MDTSLDEFFTNLICFEAEGDSLVAMISLGVNTSEGMPFNFMSLLVPLL